QSRSALAFSGSDPRNGGAGALGDGESFGIGLIELVGVPARQFAGGFAHGCAVARPAASAGGDLRSGRAGLSSRRRSTPRAPTTTAASRRKQDGFGKDPA